MSTTDTDPITCYHGLTPHLWEPDRYCPPEPTRSAAHPPLTGTDVQGLATSILNVPDTERDERLRGIQARIDASAYEEFGGEEVGYLLAEVARLDAVVTAVREEHDPNDEPSAGPTFCHGCWGASGRTVETPYPCPTVRALDGGAA